MKATLNVCPSCGKEYTTPEWDKLPTRDRFETRYPGDHSETVWFDQIQCEAEKCGKWADMEDWGETRVEDPDDRAALLPVPRKFAI